MHVWRVLSEENALRESFGTMLKPKVYGVDPEHFILEDYALSENCHLYIWHLVLSRIAHTRASLWAQYE